MDVRLYSVTLSHPGRAVHLMLKRKAIEHEVVDLMPGIHPLLLRAHGFSGTTVPALRIDGRRLQGSRVISHALEEIVPEPALFPGAPEQRRAVEKAEEWGERVLQPLPRQIFRWGVASRPDLRRWIAADAGMPAPDVVAPTMTPIARVMARKSRASDANVRASLAALPALLDHADSLIAAGVIGSGEPNAADYQIGTTVRVILALRDLRPLAEGRPVAELALRLQPRYPDGAPGFLPPDWLPGRE